ncbi:MAG: T9SS type A sorting domain-containing protein [Bacteroidota bacterium]
MKKYFFLILFVFSNTFIHAQINEGDTLQFWSVSYVDWPPLWGTPQRIVNAVCKKAGQHCYVFVEDVATQPSQAALDTLVHRFDEHYFPNLTPLYGPVPDAFDNDSNVFILALDETNWAGYFDPGQQMPDTFIFSHWGMHSSQREMIFVAAYYFSGAPSIVAHEFGHLLHWQQDHSPEPPVNPVKYWEEAWIDEGFSTFAAEFLTQNITQQGVMHNNAFFASNPDLPLIYFLSGASYDQVLMWTVFMFEHYGGTQYIKTLIQEQANGIDGMRNALDSLGYSESFEDAFEQWIVANYIDDPVFESGKYSYFHFNFPVAQQTYVHNVYPTGPKTQTVTPFGADYNIFNATSSGQLSVTFNGDDTLKYRLAFVLMNTATSTIVDVISAEPDAQNEAVFNAADFGTEYNKIVMAVMCIDTALSDSSTAAYSYSAAVSPASVEDIKTRKEILLFPVPASDILNVTFGSDAFPDSCGYEISGSGGTALLAGKISAKSAGINISKLKPAVYFIEIRTSGNVYFNKFIKQ